MAPTEDYAKAMLARRALQRPHSPLISFCRLLHKKRPYSYKKFKKSDFMAELGQEDQVVLISGEILYGYYPVLLALEARRRRFHALYYNPDGEEKVRRLAEAAASRGVPTRPTDSASLSEMAARSDKVRGVHQGVCADVDRLSLERIPDDVEDDDASRPLLWLLLCGLRDPMNLGAVIRSAYYLGVDRVITTTEFPSSSPTPVVSKASSGALEIFPPASVPSARDFLSGRGERGWQVVGADPPRLQGEEDDDGGAAAAAAAVSPDRPTVLVLGSEGAGIPEELRPLCHSGFLRLSPGRSLHPGVDSLNVSVAAALLVQKLKQT